MQAACHDVDVATYTFARLGQIQQLVLLLRSDSWVYAIYGVAGVADGKLELPPGAGHLAAQEALVKSLEEALERSFIVIWSSVSTAAEN